MTSAPSFPGPSALFSSQPTHAPGQPEDTDLFLQHGELKTFRKGAILYRQGMQPRGVHLLMQGKVKVYRQLSAAQRQIFFFHVPGELLGCRQVITDTPYNFQAEALESCRTLFIPAENFVKMARQSPAFAHFLLEQQSHEFSAWANNCALVARRSVRERLAVCLLNLERIFHIPSNPTTVICLSRTDLANYAATSLETTVRILREMKDAGMVHIRGRRIMLLDAPALVQLSIQGDLKKIEA